MILKKVVTFICLGLYHCLGTIHTHTHTLTTQNPAGLYSERVRVRVQSGSASSRLTLFSILFPSSGLILLSAHQLSLTLLLFSKVNKMTCIIKLYVYVFIDLSAVFSNTARFMVLWKTRSLFLFLSNLIKTRNFLSICLGGRSSESHSVKCSCR